jgi:hypothetical protein
VALKVSQEFQNIMNRIHSDLVDIAGEPIGFTLIVYTDGRASYGSNCPREEVVSELKKLLDHWEQGFPDVPYHKVQ